MDNDPLFKLYKLYCESIVENAREEASKLYLAQIAKLTEQIDYLHQLLAENNIIY